MPAPAKRHQDEIAGRDHEEQLHQQRAGIAEVEMLEGLVKTVEVQRLGSDAAPLFG
jgi:hypothetical protein